MFKLYTLLTLFSVFVLCISACGQENLPEFGVVDTADLKMKECAFDKGADAMYLINYENAEFDVTPAGYFIDIEHWVRIKIFKQSGFGHARVVIPFISKNRASRIINIAAKTYTLDENGKIDVLTTDKSEIFNERTGKDESSVRFAFPGVKVGSVIELKYTEKRQFTLYLAPWLFQDIIPTRLSVCKLKYQIKMGIAMRLIATIPVNVEADTTNSENITCRYIANNIPAFKPEPMMTSVKDNLQRLEFAATPASVPIKGGVYWVTFFSRKNVEDNWALLNTELLESPQFGGQLTIDVPGTKTVTDSIKKLHSVEEKIGAVCTLVKNNVKWNQDHEFSTADISEAWNNKSGNKTEINLLMLNLLRKSGVNAFPLLVSSRGNGKTDMNFPDYGQFDGTDVLIGDSSNYYVLDGTQLYLSYNIPPFDILNRYALLVDKKKGKWMYISDPRPLMKNFISVKADIDSSGTMTGEVRIAYYDYAKADVLNASKDQEAEESKDLLQTDAVDLKIDSIKEEGADDIGKPLIKSFKFTLGMQQTGDFYFLDPFFLSPFRKNPFIDTGRHSTIDFGCNQYYSINMYIGLPGNITASDLPPNKEIRLADSSFSFGRFIARQGDAIIVRNHFEVLNPIFAAEDYPFVKQVFEKMYALLNERIVFKKTD